ncbi:hypothetical protein HMPREF9444_01396 [Succinatimonas hippei YIT 12066]|uniref:Uncharacterized protein n=1 Tax=Succinatimonas hippei (strain DSM 22608 / JCM 16073 / KCTC 15190 / YIT 12066) TaxID=762983 RepID=E8LKZ1_SUCHY|nr:hypothetical protein HMPREF9444_01396 [Succinatimonas hippei YIT 12066]
MRKEQSRPYLRNVLTLFNKTKGMRVITTAANNAVYLNKRRSHL